MRIVLSFLLILVMAGCVSSGPSGESAQLSALQQAVPSDVGEIQFWGPAHWFPNTQSVESLKDSFANYLTGYLVVTKAATIFYQWNPSLGRFNALREVRYSEARQAYLDRTASGFNRLIVFERASTGFDAFRFLSAAGLNIEAAKTQAAFDFINAARKKS